VNELIDKRIEEKKSLLREELILLLQERKVELKAEKENQISEWKRLYPGFIDAKKVKLARTLELENSATIIDGITNITASINKLRDRYSLSAVRPATVKYLSLLGKLVISGNLSANLTIQKLNNLAQELVSAKSLPIDQRSPFSSRPEEVKTELIYGNYLEKGKYFSLIDTFGVLGTYSTSSVTNPNLVNIIRSSNDGFYPTESLAGIRGIIATHGTASLRYIREIMESGARGSDLIATDGINKLIEEFNNYIYLPQQIEQELSSDSTIDSGIELCPIIINAIMRAISERNTIESRIRATASSIQSSPINVQIKLNTLISQLNSIKNNHSQRISELLEGLESNEFQDRLDELIEISSQIGSVNQKLGESSSELLDEAMRFFDEQEHMRKFIQNYFWKTAVRAAKRVDSARCLSKKRTKCGKDVKKIVKKLLKKPTRIFEKAEEELLEITLDQYIYEIIDSVIY